MTSSGGQLGFHQLRQAGFAARSGGDREEALSFFRRAAELAPNDPWTRNEIALELHALGRLDEGEAEVRALAETAPDFAPARRTLGLFARARGARGEAAEHFRAATERDGRDLWSRHDLAVELDQSDRHDEAEAAYRDVVRGTPVSHALRGLAWAHRRRGDRSTMIELLRAATLLTPQDPWFAIDLARELQADERFDEAEAVLEAVLRDRPTFVPALKAAGQLARRRKDLATALARLEPAAAAEPRDLALGRDVADLMRELGRLDAAEAAYGRLLEANSGFAPALRGLALVARARGAHGQATERFRAAVDAAPNDPWMRQDLAVELRALGRLDEAVAIHRETLERVPNFLHAHISLSQIAHLHGDREAAVLHLRDAAAAAPADPWPRIDLSRELLALGRAEEAERAADEALTLAPTNRAALRARFNATKARGNVEDAIAFARDTFGETPDDPWIGIEFAALLREAGRWTEADALYARLAGRSEVAATALLERAACARRLEGTTAAHRLIEEAHALAPTDARANLMLADVLREAGRLDEADEYYDAALAARPDFYWALIGKGLVARRRRDEEGSQRFFLRAAEIDPLEGHAQIELASDLRDAGRIAPARALLDTVPAHSPRARAALQARAQIERSIGNWSAAAALFAEMARKWPDHVEALVDQAQDEFRAGRGETSHTLLRRAAALAPESPAVLEALAQQASIRDDLQTSLAILRRVAELDPTRIWVHLGIARTAMMLGRREEALAALDTVDARFGPRAETALARADMLHQLGHYAAERETLAQAREAFPDHFMLFYQQTVATIDTGAFEAAEATLADAPAGTVGEHGRVHFLRALLADARWDFATGIAEAEAAIDALPADGWIRNRLIHAALLSLDLDRAERHLHLLADLEGSANLLRGKSTNISQSHYGQLFDEFRMDRDGLGELTAALALPPADRLPRLAEIVGDYPDYTAAAVLFFIELRRSGRLARPAAPSSATESAIPRRIHQFWDEEDLPFDIAELTESWIASNPGFAHRIWSDTSASDFLARIGATRALDAYRRAREPAMKADLFRLALLWHEGGVYADADDRCTRAIAPLLAPGREMVSYQEDIGSLGNNFIAVVPGHPIIGRAFELAVDAVNRGDTDILWLATGPGLLTRAAAEVIAAPGPEAEAVAAGLHVLERHALLAHVSIHCLTSYKHTEKHWSRTAFGRMAAPRRRDLTPNR